MNIVRDPDRREVLAASAAVAASSLIAMQARAATASDALRQFNIDVPQAELDELRRRISATRWPEKETVTDESQGHPDTLNRCPLLGVKRTLRFQGVMLRRDKPTALAPVPQFIAGCGRHRIFAGKGADDLR
jgi:Epoxide hydrolase N terminus